MRILFTWLVVSVVAVGCKKEPAPAEAPKPAAEAKPAVEAKAAEAPKPAAPPSGAARVIEMKVTAEGFQPGNLTLKKDEPVKLVVTRVSDETCATELLIADTDIKADLPLNKPVEIAWTPTKAGQVKFGCAMGMMVSGMLLVE